MIESRKQLLRMLTRIEQQVIEAENHAVQPGDDEAMRWASAALNKIRVSLRRQQKNLKQESLKFQ